MPEISVIVPVYNVEKHLKKFVDSILNQSFKDFELILVDDGSCDSCPKICDAYKNEGRAIAIHQKNSGVSLARNAGIEIANGKYIAFVDSDDYLEPNYLEELHKAAKKTGACLSVCGFAREGQAQEKQISFVEENETKVIERKDFLGCFGKLNLDDKTINLTHSVWAKLFRFKKENFPRFKKGVKHGQDYLFNLDFFETLGSVCVVGKCLYHYVSREGSAVTLMSKKRMECEIFQTDATVEFVKKNCPKSQIKFAYRFKKQRLYRFAVKAKNADCPSGELFLLLQKALCPKTLLCFALSLKQNIFLCLIKFGLFKIAEKIYQRRFGQN